MCEWIVCVCEYGCVVYIQHYTQYIQTTSHNIKWPGNETIIAAAPDSAVSF